MKTLHLFITLIILLSANQLLSQTSSNSYEIDPRQFIEIHEVRNFKKKILLYKWKEGQISNQERKIIDEKSIVRIDFNKDSLAKATKFKGSIYVQAVLIGKEGSENPAEVLPYTKIGEDRTLIGIPTRPSEEIAQIFINLLQQSFLLKSKYSEFRGIEEGFGGVTNSKSSRKLPQENEIRTAHEILGLVLKYISFFKESGTQAEDAFLSLIGLDYLSLDQTELLLKTDFALIDTLLNKEDYKSSGSEIADVFDHTSEILDNLTQLNGTATNEIIGQILNNDPVALAAIAIGGEANHEQQSYTYTQNGIVIREKSNDNQTKILTTIPLTSKIYRIIIETIKAELTQMVAIKASESIFIDLDYATVDLLKEGGKVGDILYLNLILANKDRRSNLNGNTIREKIFPIGRFTLNKTGWKPKVSDSFFLVDRIEEPSSLTAPNTSPSNFKGAPGVTLNATLYQNGNPRNWFLNFLEPSIGIDVSYVDFDTDKDVEIGFGIVAGLFQNKIFCMYGVNLNATGNDEISPYYFGLGFSFTQLGDKLINN